MEQAALSPTKTEPSSHTKAGGLRSMLDIYEQQRPSSHRRDQSKHKGDGEGGKQITQRHSDSQANPGIKEALRIASNGTLPRKDSQLSGYSTPPDTPNRSTSPSMKQAFHIA